MLVYLLCIDQARAAAQCHEFFPVGLSLMEQPQFGTVVLFIENMKEGYPLALTSSSWKLLT